MLSVFQPSNQLPSLATSFAREKNLINKFKNNKTKKSTKRSYGAAIREFNNYCADNCVKNPFKLSYNSAVELVMYFVSSIAEKGLKTASISVYRAALKQLFIENGYEISPTTDIRVKELLLTISKTNPVIQKQKDILQYQHIEQMIEKCDVIKKSGLRNRAIFAVAYCAGFRADELCRLKVEELSNFDRYSFTVKMADSKTGSFKKEVMAISNIDVVKYLKKWIEVSKIESGYLFPRISTGDNVINGGVDHINMTAMVKLFKKYTEMIGLDNCNISVHSTRRGVATDLLRNGADIKSVQNLLNHKSEKMTLRYQAEALGREHHAAKVIPAKF